MGAGAPREHIADGVSCDLGAGVATPSGEEITCFPIQIGQGKAVATAARRRPNFRHLHQTRPKAAAFGAER